MSARNIMVALPAYNGTVRVETAACLVQASRECTEMGWNFNFQLCIGDSILPRARNRFIANAIADKTITDLVFLDHDISWGKNAFIRLMSHPVDMVAGVYPKREDPISFPCRFLDNEPIKLDEDKPLIEVEGVPAGFLRISTKALRVMVDHYYHLKYEENEAHNKTAWSLFDFQQVDGRYWGEDFVFCRRWRAMGGKVYVDPVLDFAHIGNKAFHGCMADWLKWEAEQKLAASKPVVRVPANSSARA